MTSTLKTLGNIIAEAVLPSFCYNCKEPGTYLCPDCFWKLAVMYEPACPHCETRLPFGELSKECRRELKLHRVFASGLYSDRTLNTLIKDLKYRGAYRLAESLARFAYWHLEQGSYAEIIKENVDLIIPVPMHRRKLKKRGFNHAQKIAEHLSGLFEIPLDTSMLVKIKKTDSQVESGSKEERKKNLANAFAVTGLARDSDNRVLTPVAAANKTVLLVDDVITTGSTLRECAKVLLDAEAKEVWGLTIAKD